MVNPKLATIEARTFHRGRLRRGACGTTPQSLKASTEPPKAPKPRTPTETYDALTQCPESRQRVPCQLPALDLRPPGDQRFSGHPKRLRLKPKQQDPYFLAVWAWARCSWQGYRAHFAARNDELRPHRVEILTRIRAFVLHDQTLESEGAELLQ